MNKKLLIVCLMSSFSFLGLNAMLAEFIVVQPGMELPRPILARNIAVMIRQHLVDLDESDEEFGSFLERLEAQLRAYTIYLNEPFQLENSFDQVVSTTLKDYCAGLRLRDNYKNARLLRVKALLNALGNNEAVAKPAPIAGALPASGAMLPSPQGRMLIDDDLAISGVDANSFQTNTVDTFAAGPSTGVDQVPARYRQPDLPKPRTGVDDTVIDPEDDLGDDEMPSSSWGMPSGRTLFGLGLAAVGLGLFLWKRSGKEEKKAEHAD